MAIRDTGTEKLIMDTARKVFFTEGRFYATTQDIADAAGICRTSLHYYFRSRDALLKQVFEESMRELNGSLYELMASSISFREKVERMVALFIGEMMAFPYKEIYLISKMLANDMDIFEVKQHAYPYIRTFLAEIGKEMQLGNLPKMRPVQFMINLLALTSHPLIMRPLNKALFNLTEEQYNRLISERKKLIIEMIFR